MSTDSEPQHAVRVRLISAPVKRKKVNFATLIKNAALAASIENGDQETGVEQLFDKRVGNSGETASSWQRSTQEYFLWMSSLALFGVLLAIAVNEILWYSAVGFETVDTVFTTILKISVLVTTAVSIFLLYKYYDGQLEMLRTSGVGLSEGFGFMSLRESGLWSYFLADLFTLLPMPFPFIHFTIEMDDVFHEDTPTIYTSDNLLMALMFVRFQFLPRLIAEIWMMNNHVAFMSARMHNIVIDTWFVIRALFIANFATLIGLIFATILASSYIILICERPYPHVDQLAEFDNALYYTIITMTTVGYGDIVPDTRLGRYAALAISLQGVVFIALIIQGVVARVGLSPTETRIIDFVVGTHNASDTRNKAAIVMQTVFRQYRTNLRAISLGRSNVMVKSHPKVTSCLRLFLSAQRLQETESGLDVHTESTHKGIDFLGDRFEEMEENIKKIMKALKVK